jgi:4-hydroxythreonine-4-phosphate dehydrogenase
MKKVAISIGDLNGIGIQLALEHHDAIKAMVEPIYCIEREMLEQAARLLGRTIPDDFRTVGSFAKPFTIRPGTVDAASGAYSYESFVHAVALARADHVDAVTTLPIHKQAWEQAGIEYKGHTDALRDWFDAEAIMMLGCPEMYVALYTEHIPLRQVADAIDETKLTRFLLDFYRTAKPTTPVAVLGLNPHAGDGGVLGDEERIIERAIQQANQSLSTQHETRTAEHGTRPTFTGPIVPDIAFTPRKRETYSYYVAMYHDQGLAPLKALYFDEGINVSLNLPILRTSVDHGTAFDVAYQSKNLNGLSYRNAIKYATQNGQP